MRLLKLRRESSESCASSHIKVLTLQSSESGIPETAFVPTATGEHIEVGRGGTVFDAETHP